MLFYIQSGKNFSDLVGNVSEAENLIMLDEKSEKIWNDFMVGNVDKETFLKNNINIIAPYTQNPQEFLQSAEQFFYNYKNVLQEAKDTQAAIENTDYYFALISDFIFHACLVAIPYLAANIIEKNVKMRINLNDFRVMNKELTKDLKKAYMVESQLIEELKSLKLENIEAKNEINQLEEYSNDVIEMYSNLEDKLKEVVNQYESDVEKLKLTNELNKEDLQKSYAKIEELGNKIKELSYTSDYFTSFYKSMALYLTSEQSNDDEVASITSRMSDNEKNKEQILTNLQQSFSLLKDEFFKLTENLSNVLPSLTKINFEPITSLKSKSNTVKLLEIKQLTDQRMQEIYQYITEYADKVGSLLESYRVLPISPFNLQSPFQLSPPVETISPYFSDEDLVVGKGIRKWLKKNKKFNLDFGNLPRMDIDFRKMEKPKLMCNKCGGSNFDDTYYGSQMDNELNCQKCYVGSGMMMSRNRTTNRNNYIDKYDKFPKYKNLSRDVQKYKMVTSLGGQQKNSCEVFMSTIDDLTKFDRVKKAYIGNFPWKQKYMDWLTYLVGMYEHCPENMNETMLANMHALSIEYLDSIKKDVKKSNINLKNLDNFDDLRRELLNNPGCLLRLV